MLANKPFIKICLLLFILHGPHAFALIAKAAQIFHPANSCELIRDIQTANSAGGGPKVIDLQDQVFLLTTDCATQASLCVPALPAAACFANGANYAHGPSGLPEIKSGIKIVNGRIVRAIGNTIPPFRIFTVANFQGSADLSLFKVTLENGLALAIGSPGADSGNGGALFVDNGAHLVLQSSKVAFNQAKDSGGGIFIAGGGRLDVQTSIISHNTAQADNPLNTKGGGGGIYLARTNEELAALLGSLDNSTVSHNQTPALGGGINNQGTAANIFNSTISYNKTCIDVPGSGECGNGANPSGAGGGIYNDTTALFLELTQSTLWGNRALTGGGIYNEEATIFPPPPTLPPSSRGVLMNNNTIANNFAQLNGGGIYNSGNINQFVSNLIAQNTDFDGNNAPDIYSVVGTISAPSFLIPPSGNIVEGFNLVGDCGTTGQCSLVNGVNFDIVGGSANNSLNIDPRIHDLAPNGGPTETVALFPDSPAINNGYNNLLLEFDQRGPRFFRTVGKTDIGSFEVQYDLYLTVLRLRSH